MSAALHILQHSLGLDQHGRGEAYRNHFVTSAHTTDWSVCRQLVEQGLMTSRPMPSALTGGGVCFSVTEAGRRYVAEHSPKPPKLTASQRRYRAFLDEDSGMRFGEWLKSRNHDGSRP